MTIVPYGFRSKEDKYYQIIPILKSDRKRIPTVAYKHNQPHCCAIVEQVSPVTRHYQYVKPENLEDEVKQWLKDHNYTSKEEYDKKRANRADC